MGTFQVTYDDFSGGQYMGNRAAMLPKNTWFGTNAVLNGQGELIPSGTGEVTSFAAPTLPSGATNWISGDIWGFFNYASTLHIISTYVTFTTGIQSTTRYHRIVAAPIPGSRIISTYTLTGKRVVGQTVWDPTLEVVFFVDSLTADICRVSSTGTVTVVSTVFSANDITSLAIYKSRMLAYTTFGKKLYYSDPTMTTWSLTDYYELPGDIQTVIPRSNDIIVVTDAGVYSITGVFGESINIQLIMPVNEQVPGMSSAVATGRSVLFVGDEELADPRLYEFLGATTSEVARFPQSDVNESLQSNTFATVENNYQVAIGAEAKGTICTFIDSGVLYARANTGETVRLKITNSVDKLNPTVAQNVFTNTTNYGDAYVAAFDSDAGNTGYGTLYVYLFGYERPIPSTAFKTIDGLSAPGSATVDLAEYWHSKPCSIKEVLVEAVYDTTGLLDLSGNASVAATMIPTGAVDMTVNQTGALASDTQTYTTTISSVSANNSRVLHRFRIDNGNKSYGFFPRITWQGCRIRRVIVTAED